MEIEVNRGRMYLFEFYRRKVDMMELLVIGIDDGKIKIFGEYIRIMFLMFIYY